MQLTTELTTKEQPNKRRFIRIDELQMVEQDEEKVTFYFHGFNLVQHTASIEDASMLYDSTLAALQKYLSGED